MKENRLAFTLLLLLSAAVFQLPAQQSETGREQFDEIKAKAEKGDAKEQYKLANCYYRGDGVPKDFVEAVNWFRKSAEQGNAMAQCNLAKCYAFSEGVAKNVIEAVKWWRRASDQGESDAQFYLGMRYTRGDGVPKDYVEAHKWLNLAAAQGDQYASQFLSDKLEPLMTRDEITEARRLAREFKPRSVPKSGASASNEDIADSRPSASGTGFFITEDGFLITNNHVVEGANQFRLVTSAGLISAKVIKVDAANDLALLKAEGKFSPLPVAPSRGVKLGGTVVTVGFPVPGLQGFSPKFAKGEIASLSGAADDARYFQISVPVQPGNSGGALVNELGNVVGVVSAKLSAVAALKTSGSLPENVNYAVKSSYLLGFLESVPDVAAKLKEVNSKERKFDDVVKDAEKAAVLVLVY